MVLGRSERGKGGAALSTASDRNCHSRQKRNPAKLPRSRQVTAIHTQGEIVAPDTVGRRGASSGGLIVGWTDTDVMMVDTDLGW